MFKSYLLLAGLPLFALFGSGAWAAAGKSSPTPVLPPAPLPQTGYFFTIDLDPRYQIVGAGALTEMEAAGANCYHFMYDNAGKLKEIEYRRAGVSMPDPVFGVADIHFEYLPGIERRWYRDAQDQPVKTSLDGIAGEELTLNPAGYPTDVANLDESGTRIRDANGVIHYLRTLDSLNRVVTARRIGLLGTAITDNGGFFETRTVYDDQNHPMERDNYDSSGNLLDNNDGVAVTRTTTTIYPDSTQTIESYFDASGLAVEDKSTGAHQIERSIDQRGFLLSESYFDVTGAPSLDNQAGIHERRYQYDDRGNLVSESFFGIDGKPKDQKTPDFARVAYKYDDKDRIIEKAYFGDDGTPQILLGFGAAIVRQEYDAQGTLVRRQFFDGQGHPSPHLQYGSPAIRIKVEGDTTYVSLRDAEDKPMPNPVAGYYSFSYKTDEDQPLTLKNQYFDRRGRPMSQLRVRIINPHLHALATTPVMQISARCGAGAAGLGALLACLLALRKSSHTRRRKVYVPTPLERLLGWFSIFAIVEGTLRFFITVYWAWVGYQNGRMGPGVYILETIFILFFLYRLMRLRLTMRVLNIGKDDVHRLVRDFFLKARLEPKWVVERDTFVTDGLSVRVRYYAQKCHAYLSFSHIHSRDLTRGLAHYIRAHASEITAPTRSRAIALYYPIVAFCYLLLSGTAFYTLWQLVKSY
jgi:hypothetical protein